MLLKGTFERYSCTFVQFNDHFRGNKWKLKIVLQFLSSHLQKRTFSFIGILFGAQTELSHRKLNEMHKTKEAYFVAVEKTDYCALSW